MEFERVKPTKASSFVGEQILNAIKTGALPIGGRLPSESQLAEKMGVSRPTVREALSGLAAVGLIQSRPGNGNYVCNPGRSAEREFLILLEKEESCVEIVQVRGLLEPPVASLAASQRTDEDVVRLRVSCHRLRRLAQRGKFDPYLDADKEFHLAVLAAARNHLLEAVLGPLIKTMDQQLYREFTHRFYLTDPSELGRVVTLQEEIANRIIEKDPQGAFERMDEHWRRMRATWGT